MEAIDKTAIQFKTNIKCGACVATVTPFLNEAAGEGNWQVDTQNPSKILTVPTDKATPEAIKAALQKAGYKAEVI